MNDNMHKLVDYSSYNFRPRARLVCQGKKGIGLFVHDLTLMKDTVQMYTESGTRAETHGYAIR